VQKTLVQCWGLVQQIYVDPSFNGQGDQVWQGNLESALTGTFRAAGTAEAYDQVDRMLGTLGDPFTRLLRPVAAKAYNMQVDGQVESFGMVAIPAELSDGREITIVAQVAEGGAAEAAGIRVGDELVAVNGRLTSKMSMKMLQLVLDEGGRNKEVVLTINQDGVVRKVRIYRTALAYNPVQYGILPLQRYSPASTSSESPAEGQQDVQVKLGYIRLGVFSTNAGKEVRAAVKDLEEMGAQGYILDLRNNSGGAIAAGMEVAKVPLLVTSHYVCVRGMFVNRCDSRQGCPCSCQQLDAASAIGVLSGLAFPL